MQPFWTGYSAFQLINHGRQWEIIAAENDARPFLVNDACDPQLPDWLFTTRWGEWGYSTWCNSIGTALKEAGNSKSRGWKRVPRMDYNQLSDTRWIVFEMTLCAQQVRDYLNRFKLSSHIERKGVPSWRIPEDIFVPDIQTKGGRVNKHLVKGWETAVFRCYNNITPDLDTTNGNCICCRRNAPLCARQCSRCWNNKVEPTCLALTQEPDALEDAFTPGTDSRNKIPRGTDV